MTILVSSTLVVLPPLASPASADLTPPAPPAAVNPAPYLKESTTPGPTRVGAGSGYVQADHMVWGPLGSPYIVTGPFGLAQNQSLTLLPGTVVKIAPGASPPNSPPSMRIDGSLYVLGTPQNRVTFTSSKDDTVGGDSNGDGGATSPARGNWVSIQFDHGTGILKYVDIKYGGAPTTGFRGSIVGTADSRVAVSHARITQSSSTGVQAVHNSDGYFGLFDSELDHNTNYGMVVTYGGGPTVVVGNDFGADIGGPALDLSFRHDVDFHYNTVHTSINVHDSLAPYRNDLRFNKVFGNINGNATANWFGHDINTEILPPCMTQAAMNAHIPKLAPRSSIPFQCPGWPNEFPPGWANPSVVPALSGSPGGVPSSVFEAAAPRFSNVDTYRGVLSYRATDLTINDAGKALSADRLYRSDRLANGDAGPGWSTSFSEALSTAQGLASLSLPDGSSLPFVTDPAAGYVPSGGIVASYSSGPSGSAITGADQVGYQFNPAGELTGLLLGDPGHQVQVDRSNGQLSKVTGVSGRYLSYQRQGGKLADVSDSGGRHAMLTYTSSRLTGVSGVDGQTEHYEYDSAGRLTKVVAPSGLAKLAAAYSSDGRVEWIEEAGKGRSTFSYDSTARKTTITRADGSQIFQLYDEQGRLCVEQVAGGSARHVMYDGAGRVIAEVGGVPSVPLEGYGPLASVKFIDHRGDAIVTSDAAGNPTRHTYNNAHKPLATKLPDSSQVIRTYNAAGRQDTVTDQAGGIWSYTYNSRGQVLTQTNSMSQNRVLTYEADGDLATMTDPSGAVTSYEYDNLGRPIATTDPSGNRHLIGYTAWGEPNSATPAGGTASTREFNVDRQVSAELDPLGNRTTYEFDTVGRISAIVDALGQRAIVEYDPIGRPNRTTDVRGTVRLTGYAPDSTVISETGPAGGSIVTARDPAGRPTRVTNPLGQVTQTAYFPTGQTRKVDLPDGSSHTYAIDKLGRVTSYLDGRGKSWSRTYDLSGRLTKTTDPLGYTRQWTYDPLGRVTTSTNELSQATTTSYDDTARTVTVTDPLGTGSVRSYSPRGDLLGENDGSGRVTQHEYRPDGLLAATIAPGGGRTEYQYDAAGRLAGVTDPITRHSTITTDELGRTTKITDPAGHDTIYDYEPGSLVRLVTDRTGRVAAYQHDSWGLLNTATDPAGKQTTYTYDPLGRQTRITDATGVQQNTAYDPVGRPAVQWDTIGASTVTNYDFNGNVTSITGPDNVTWTYGYNNRNELTTARWAQAAYYFTFGYDNAGNLTSRTRPQVPTETYTYDQRGRMATSTSSDAKVTTYSYDGAGREASITTPSGKTTQWTYDAAGQMATAVDPLSNTSSYIHDAAGQLTKLTQPRGVFYEYTYNALGAIATQKDPNNQITELTYDHEGRLTKSELPSGREVLSRYDNAGRLWQQEAGSTVRTLSYDSAGRLASATATGQPIASFTYNNRGLLASSTDQLGQTVYSYDDAGRLQTVSPPSGQVTSYGYQTSPTIAGTGQLATVRGSLSADYTYTWAGDIASRTYVAPSSGRTDNYQYLNGRIKSVGPAIFTYTDDGQIATSANSASGKTTTYSYDGAGRVTGEQIADGTTVISASAYTWDADSNRASDSGTTYTYDLAGHLQTATDGSTYTYDLDGNLTNATGSQPKTLSYNEFGEFTGSGTVTYTRDGLGRLSTRSVGPITQAFGYAGPSPALSASKTGSGPLIDIVTGTAGEVLGEAAAASTRRRPVQNVHHDVTAWEDDQSGSQTASFTYSPFGKLTAASGSAPAIPFGYQGSLSDVDTGLTDMGFRTYDPSTARFTASDNILGAYGNPVSLNRYTYGNADPVNHLDPAGHWPQWLDDFAANWKAEFKAGLESKGKSNDSIARFLNSAIETLGSGITDTLQLGQVTSNCVRKEHQPSCDAVDQLFTWDAVKAMWHGSVDPIKDAWNSNGDAAKWGAAAAGVIGFFYGGRGLSRFDVDVPNPKHLPSADPPSLRRGPGEGDNARFTVDSKGVVKDRDFKAVVIGEGMVDVKTAARKIDAEWYETWGKNWPKALSPLRERMNEHNQRRWIKSKIADGYKFFSIGVNPESPRRSKWFAIELDELGKAEIVPRSIPRPQ
jgi:RHS repeat-associated protein